MNDDIQDDIPEEETDRFFLINLLRDIAILSDAMGLGDGDWSEADDELLFEQFDPWDVLRKAINHFNQEITNAPNAEATH